MCVTAEPAGLFQWQSTLWVPCGPTWCITGVLQQALEPLVLPFEVLNLGCAVLAAAGEVLALEPEGCSNGIIGCDMLPTPHLGP